MIKRIDKVQSQWDHREAFSTLHQYRDNVGIEEIIKNVKVITEITNAIELAYLSFSVCREISE